LGQRARLATVVDETAQLFDTVFVSAGRRGLSVELAPAELVRLTDAVLADIAR
jgi:Cys-tRNA(Pro)/Cys-tRNA(Cys) deacylase